ncbi:MAG: hypothetical protein EZS28_051506 [Streblomastix strix]|uniref:Uncharacterized protein n=1 Tax=Streblomastix strix TaxID=222440 RepID=A0A5J4T4D9_9EUKA|nr:MAG: hypothetical protein EZS28_051506 [Streblomastix strix]
MNQCPECPECPESQGELLGFLPYQTLCHIELWNINMKCPIQKSNGIMSLMAEIRAVQLVTQDTQDTQDARIF